MTTTANANANANAAATITAFLRLANHIGATVTMAPCGHGIHFEGVNIGLIVNAHDDIVMHTTDGTGARTIRSFFGPDAAGIATGAAMTILAAQI